MCNSVWEALGKRYQIRRDARETWRGRRIAGTHDLPRSVTFEQIGSLAVRGALDDLLGRGSWQTPSRWVSLLVTFPQPCDRWDVPHQSWHLDFPASRSLQGLFAVRLFTCLDKPAPGGGGTVFVAGPHELLKNLVRQEGVEKLHSADARKVLIRTCPWIERLCSFDERIDRVREFMKSEAVVNRVWLRVVEMTGEPGDLWLTDPLMLHARAQNCAEVPRLVLSSIVHRREVPLGAIHQSSS